MNLLDISILIVLAVGFVFGWRKGFIMTFFTFVSFAVGLYFAFHFSDKIAHYFMADKHEGILVAFLSFVIVFIALVVLIRVVGRLFEKLIEFVWLSVFNKMFGGVFGVLKWGLLASCALLFLQPLDPENKWVPKETKENSVLYPIAIIYAETLVPGIQETLIMGYQEAKKGVRFP